MEEEEKKRKKIWSYPSPEEEEKKKTIRSYPSLEEEKKKRKKILFLSHVNADATTSLRTRRLCHRIVINDDACSLKPAVLRANGGRRGGEGEESPSGVFLLDHHL